MVTYLFPGQGVQRKGMGADLFGAFPEETAQASELLGYSLPERCLEDPGSKLAQTAYTQPALYVVGALAYKQHISQGGAPAQFLAGHSLGEYNALHAAGVFSFEDGLRLVAERGRLMGQSQDGAMAAVVGMGVDVLQQILADHSGDTVQIANYNSPDQTVIAGPPNALTAVAAVLKEQGAIVIMLKTSGAFHTVAMRAASEAFAAFLQHVQFAEPSVPVLSNVTARPHVAAEVPQRLVEQITTPVRWSDSIWWLLAQGQTQFEEVGGTKVLTKLLAAVKRAYHSAAPDLKSDVAHGLPYQFIAQRQRLAQEALRRIRQWNQTYPPGTKVRVTGYAGERVTRTPARLLFNHRAVLYVEGFQGYFPMDDVVPVRASEV